MPDDDGGRIAELQLQVGEYQGFLAFQYPSKAFQCHSKDQKLRRGKEEFSPKGFGGSMALLTR